MVGTQDVIPLFNQNLPKNKKSAIHSPGASAEKDLSQNFGEIPNGTYGDSVSICSCMHLPLGVLPAISTFASLYYFFYSPNMQIHQRRLTPASAFIHWPSNVALPNQVSNLSMHQTHLEDSFKHRSPHFFPRISVDLE